MATGHRVARKRCRSAARSRNQFYDFTATLQNERAFIRKIHCDLFFLLFFFCVGPVFGAVRTDRTAIHPFNLTPFIWVLFYSYFLVDIWKYDTEQKKTVFGLCNDCWCICCELNGVHWNRRVFVSSWANLSDGNAYDKQMDKIVIMCVTLYLTGVRFFGLAMQRHAFLVKFGCRNIITQWNVSCDAHHVRRSFALTICGYSVFECSIAKIWNEERRSKPMEWIRKRAELGTEVYRN